MTKVSFVDKLAQKGSVPVHFITCKDPEGRDCYYFLVAPQAAANEVAKIQDGVFDLNDYGQILASGFGTKPSEEVKQQLREEYDIMWDK